MQNPSLAIALQFNTADLAGQDLQNRWRVHKDSSLGKFVIIFMEKRISELQVRLEKCPSEELQSIQGQIVEARKLREFLNQSDIKNEIETVAAYLGVKK